MAAENDENVTRHRALVDALGERGLLPDPRVEAAFRAVPRHLFLPGVPAATVYSDEAIPTRRREGFAISSSSQPAVMAIMLEQLDLRPGDRVLEIGAGTGYNAALIAHIVGPGGTVVSVDIDEDIVEEAQAHLTRAGFSGVRVVCGDGALGYGEAAPFDRIILAVGAWDIAPAWIEQLRPGGRLVLPLALTGTAQKIVAFERRDGHLASVSVQDGGFMPLRGVAAGPPVHFPLGNETGLVLTVGAPRPVDAGHVYRLLTGPYEDLPANMLVTSGDLWSGISLWLALQADTTCTLIGGDTPAGHIVPSLFSASPAFRASIGLLEDSISLLARPTGGPFSAETPFPLAIRRFGSGDDAPRRLFDLLHGWDRAGRPSTGRLHLTVYPRGSASSIPPGDTVIHKPRSDIVLAWQQAGR